MAANKTETMISFYTQCLAKGYVDMTDDKQSLKAKVIATDLGLNYKGNMIAFYEEAKRLYDEKQEQEEAAARRQAVNGEPIFALSVSHPVQKDAKELTVYKREDGSFYCTLNGGSDKIEGTPGFYVKRGQSISYTYNPSKAIYTGATVGGVTTGGVHYTQASYSMKAESTGKGEIYISTDNKSYHIKSVTLPDFVITPFHRDEVFKSLVDNGKILCTNSSASSVFTSGMSPFMSREEQITMANMALDAARLPYDKCVAIVELVGRILHGKFPPSDEQLYEQANQLGETARTSAQFKKAEEAFLFISDYKDAAARAQALHNRYEEVLQEEKEQAILRKEREAEERKKAKKRFLTVYLPLIVLCVAAGFVVKSIVLPNIAYREGESLLAAGNYDDAIALFGSLEDYKDSTELILSAKYAKAEKALEVGEYEAAESGFMSLGEYMDSAVRLQETYYTWAEASFANGDIEGALRLFESAGDYHDASDRFKEVEKAKKEAEKADLIAKAEALAESGDKAGAAIAFYNIPDYKEGRERSLALWDEAAQRDTIACGKHIAYALCSDGTVVSTEEVYKLGDNKYVTRVIYGPTGPTDNIVAIAASDSCFACLSSDGIVIENFKGSRVLMHDGWTDIVAIATGDSQTFGLRADGTVIGSNSSLSDYRDWTDIVAIAAGADHVVGLRADGTVVSTRFNSVSNAFGRRDYGQCDTSNWKNIVAIAAGSYYTVGLRADGTVIVAGSSGSAYSDTGDWTDIVAIATGGGYTFGLRTDGTVVVAGERSQRVGKWTDIVAIASGEYFTIGLRADGTVISAEHTRNSYDSIERGYEYIADWRNIRVPNT